MNPTCCIIERSLESNDLNLGLYNSESECARVDENTKTGIRSFIYCQRARFTKAETQKLHSVLRFPYLFRATVWFINLLVMALISANSAARDAVTSQTGLIMLFTYNLLYVIYLLAKKQYVFLRLACEWYVFYTHVFLDVGPPTSTENLAGLKCNALICLVPLMLGLFTLQSRYPIARANSMAFFAVAVLGMVFVFNAFVPYKSMFGLYAAAIYTVAWCMYLIHYSFELVLVKDVKDGEGLPTRHPLVPVRLPIRPSQS